MRRTRGRLISLPTPVWHIYIYEILHTPYNLFLLCSPNKNTCKQEDIFATFSWPANFGIDKKNSDLIIVLVMSLSLKDFSSWGGLKQKHDITGLQSRGAHSCNEGRSPWLFRTKDSRHPINSSGLKTIATTMVTLLLTYQSVCSCTCACTGICTCIDC